MGTCSAIFESSMTNPYSNKEIASWRTQFEALDLSQENVIPYIILYQYYYQIRTLYNAFRSIDLDKSGDIGIQELLIYLKLDGTKFENRVFAILDDDKSGKVDFREFVFSAWNYCTVVDKSLRMI